MVHRVLTGLTTLAIALAGLPPCVGMDMSSAVLTAHECCDGATCPEPDGPSHTPTPASGDDCCALGGATSPRTPVDRLMASGHAGALELTTGPVAWTSPPVRHSRSDAGPPPTLDIPRHLLYSQYLI